MGLLRWVVRGTLLQALLFPQAVGQSCASNFLTLAKFQLGQFMRLPFDPLAQTYEAIRTEQIDAASEPSWRKWFHHQMEFYKETAGPGFMVYLGTESGLFTGYMNTAASSGGAAESVYTVRNSGVSNPRSFEAFPRQAGDGTPLTSWTRADLSTPWETSDCAKGVTCQPQAPSHGCELSATCRAHVTAGGVTCPTMAACITEKKMSDSVWVQQPGTYLSSDCTSHISATDAIAAAQATCGHADCVGGLADSCHDHDIRLYFNPASATDHNLLAPASRWRFYDPRPRPWYVQAKAKFYKDGTVTSWTSTYLFASGQGGGISAVGAMSTSDVCAAAQLQADAAGCAAASAHCSAAAYSDEASCITAGLRAAAVGPSAADPADLDGDDPPEPARWVQPCLFSPGSCSDSRHSDSTTCIEGSATWTPSSCSGETLTGVLATDYTLDGISTWLQSTFRDKTPGHLSDNIVVYLVDRNTGKLLASSSIESSAEPLNHNNILVNESAYALTSEFGSVRNWQHGFNCTSVPDFLATETRMPNVRNVYTTTAAMQDSRGLNWLIVAVAVQEHLCSSEMEPNNDHTTCECKAGSRPRLEDSSHYNAPVNNGDCIWCEQQPTVCCARFPDDDELSTSFDSKTLTFSTKAETVKEREKRKCTAGEQCIECLGSREVWARRGFFVHHTEALLEVFHCPPQYCLGRSISLSVTRDNRSKVDLCAPGQPRVDLYSKNDNLGAETPFVSEPMHDEWHGNCCAKGHEGELCAYCKTSPIRYGMGDKGCVPCESPNWVRLISIFLGYAAYSTFIVVSKHYKINFRHLAERCGLGSNTITEQNQAGIAKKKVLEPTGADIPHSGAELQDAIFWMQTLSLLDLSDIITLIFDSTPSAGLTTCLIWLTPIQKVAAELYFPPLFLLFVAVCAHLCIACYLGSKHRYEDVVVCQTDQLVDTKDTDMNEERRAARGSRRKCSHWICMYNHKLKAVVVDVVFYVLMPSMNKSLKIMHCRTDTPNGVGRMHSVLAIECNGEQYDLLFACAFATFVSCGVIFPIWLMVLLFDRSSTPSTHLIRHGIEVTNIPAGIGKEDLLQHITEKSVIGPALIAVEKRRNRDGIKTALVCPAKKVLLARTGKVISDNDTKPIRLKANGEELELKLTRFHHNDASDFTLNCRHIFLCDRLRKRKPLWCKLDEMLAACPELTGTAELVPEGWATDGRKQVDWLSQVYAGIRHGCWWWPAMLLLRRTFISTFASRKDGNHMSLLGSSADWRSMVVVVLTVNILLVHIFLPSRNHALNNFSTLAMLLLVVLYVLKISDEVKLFLFIFVISLAAIIFSLGSILWKQRKKNRVTANLQKMRQAGKKAMTSFERTTTAKTEPCVAHAGLTDQTESTTSAAQHNLPQNQSTLLIPGSVPGVGPPATRSPVADGTAVTELRNGLVKDGVDKPA